ncbi:hypothetical protein BDV23DRAFT_162151 [Aspergillus alliaceus]|uniref:Uncharacterized protein n=1 Tax=Petromyces alliaceus TaxID=209559 RepID=A0A5N7BYU3_PETAA|nr:hypothetical protein BDV23DRAFT_162151 [Aspergillus alliaceus]
MMADSDSDSSFYLAEQVVSGTRFQTSAEFCAHVYSAVLQGLPDQVIVYTNISVPWGNEAIYYLDDVLKGRRFRKDYNSVTKELSVRL